MDARLLECRDGASLGQMEHRRPALKPALRRTWRDDSTLQLGLSPDHAVLIGGLDPATGRLIEALDGSADLPRLLGEAAAAGVEPARAYELLELLDQAGVLEDAAADHRALATLSQGERDRLGPDVAAASLARPGRSGGIEVLTRRRRAAVTVLGAARVGASVVHLLAAAGVGTIVVEDAAPTVPSDLAPAGAQPDQLDLPRREAALMAARRSAPSLRARLPRGRSADVTVLTVAGLPSPRDLASTDLLVRAGLPHLVVRVRETTGIIGPFVLPGESACLRCHDLHRGDRDPGWTDRISTRDDAPSAAVACDVVLAMAVAAHAALQVIAFLDGDPRPLAVDGTIEIAQSDGRVRRRTWIPHPACGCGSAWGEPRDVVRRDHRLAADGPG